MDNEDGYGNWNVRSRRQQISLNIGDVVKAKWPGLSRAFPAVVVSCGTNKTVTVKFKDYEDKTYVVPEHHVQLIVSENETTFTRDDVQGFTSEQQISHVAEIVTQADVSNSHKKRQQPCSKHEVRSKRQKVSYLAGDRVKAKWPGRESDRKFLGTIMANTEDECKIKFDYDGTILLVPNQHVEYTMDEKVQMSKLDCA